MSNEVDVIYRNNVKFIYRFGWFLKEPGFFFVFFSLRIDFISISGSEEFRPCSPLFVARLQNFPLLPSTFHSTQPRRSGFRTCTRKTADVFRFPSSDFLIPSFSCPPPLSVLLCIGHAFRCFWFLPLR